MCVQAGYMVCVSLIMSKYHSGGFLVCTTTGNVVFIQNVGHVRMQYMKAVVCRSITDFGHLYLRDILDSTVLPLLCIPLTDSPALVS